MLLAIDTSTAQVGLALYDGTQVLSEMTWTSRQHHTTELAPALAGLLSRCGVSMNMVSALGVAVGPGSFTSLRVGLSLVKGIALARHLPVVGIPTLETIALWTRRRACTCALARRGTCRQGQTRGSAHRQRQAVA